MISKTIEWIKLNSFTLLALTISIYTFYSTRVQNDFQNRPFLEIRNIPVLNKNEQYEYKLIISNIGRPLKEFNVEKRISYLEYLSKNEEINIIFLNNYFDNSFSIIGAMVGKIKDIKEKNLELKEKRKEIENFPKYKNHKLIKIKYSGFDNKEYTEIFSNKDYRKPLEGAELKKALYIEKLYDENVSKHLDIKDLTAEKMKENSILFVDK